MTEFRRQEPSGSSSSAAGVMGLFATKDYNLGDTIIEEKIPLIVLAPKEEEEDISIKYPWYSKITPPSNIDSKYHGKFRGMIKAIICYSYYQIDGDESNNNNNDDRKQSNNQEKEMKKITKKDNDELCNLYYPKFDDDSVDESTAAVANDNKNEEEIVNIAKEAYKYIKNSMSSPSSDSLYKLIQYSPKEVMKIMLIWSCNSFQGGRIYKNISRCNHSCNPNAVIKTTGIHKEGQQLLAVTKINKGEEISISYLGIFLYTETSIRKKYLYQSKHFICRCERCSSSSITTIAQEAVVVEDLAASVPCPYCHPRGRSKQLFEDVQYDDSQDVAYISPQQQPPQDNSNNVEENNHCYFRCKECKKKFTSKNSFSNNQSILPVVGQVANSISDKVYDFLLQHNNSNSNTTTTKSDNDNTLDTYVIQEYLTLSSSMLGCYHWTTNTILLLHLDDTLKKYNSKLLQQALGKKKSDDDDDDDDSIELIAECIDSLERLCRFVNHLHLKLHVGHLLSDIIIGIARVLVSFGDVKSQKYASEWLDKITDSTTTTNNCDNESSSDKKKNEEYIKHFETIGIQKVVATLHTAWEKTQEEQLEKEDNQKKKKRKT